jgi:hypothetical protein
MAVHEPLAVAKRRRCRAKVATSKAWRSCGEFKPRRVGAKILSVETEQIAVVRGWLCGT